MLNILHSVHLFTHCIDMYIYIYIRNVRVWMYVHMYKHMYVCNTDTLRVCIYIIYVHI